MFFLIGCTFHYNFSRGAYPHYTQKYFLLGSEQISSMAQKMSKTAEFRGSAELLHVCIQSIFFMFILDSKLRVKVGLIM